jgi:hypothetical protein
VGKRGKLGILSGVEHVIGYDYGTKPRVMVMGDLEFLTLLGDSFLALACAVEPQFGALLNAPMLVLVFENESGGRVCFARFKGWCEGSGGRRAEKDHGALSWTNCFLSTAFMPGRR